MYSLTLDSFSVTEPAPWVRQKSDETGLWVQSRTLCPSRVLHIYLCPVFIWFLMLVHTLVGRVGYEFGKGPTSSVSVTYIYLFDNYTTIYLSTLTTK